MQYLNTLKDEYILKKQLLSSFVLNPPYGENYLDNSSKITRCLPFGIKLNSLLLGKFIFSTLICSSIVMAIGCFITFCICLPLQAQNVQLVNKAKSVANGKLGTIVKLQEVTRSERLFNSANLFLMKEPEEVIKLNSTTVIVQKKNIKTKFNKYPSIQFAGF